MIKRAWLVLCWLWTALLMLLYFVGGADPGMIACLVIPPWIPAVTPSVWRYIVYGRSRRCDYYDYYDY